MICFIAMPVLLIMSIFSARYRKLAAEAVDCVFRKTTFRKCKSGLDKRLKSQITGKIMKKNPKLGAKIYKNFQLISTIFTIIFILSFAGSAYSVYNYWAYGNCNGPDSSAFCVFDVVAGSEDPAFSELGTASCHVDDVGEKILAVPNVDNEPYIGNSNAPITLIQFGCYTCKYTRESQETVWKVLNKYPDDIKYVYIDFPIGTHEYSYNAAVASECARQQNKFWEYHQELFTNEFNTNESFILFAEDLGLDKEKFLSCMDNNEIKGLVDKDIDLGIESGVYGTPTFFINNESIVGPNNYRTFKKIIEDELEK